jgi:hypothetical protein
MSRTHLADASEGATYSRRSISLANSLSRSIVMPTLSQ